MVCLQQIEGNLIYPRVVGNNIGLPPILLISAIILFSNFFGVPGLLVSGAFTSVLYTIIKRFVSKRLRDRAVPEEKFMPSKITLEDARENKAKKRTDIGDLIRSLSKKKDNGEKPEKAEVKKDTGSAQVVCDVYWTAEALGNIIKNCMEHTGEGGRITITARQTPLYTEIVIHDNGTGFDEEDLPHIFERFYKGKNASPNAAGIGLALAQAVISRQGGTIQAMNDHGARFVIRFYTQTI